MRKRLLLCLVVLLLVCTSCAGQNKDVNIVCYGFQAEMFRTILGAGLGCDDSLANVNCITEEDYTDSSDWHESLFTWLLTHSDIIDCIC